MKVTNLFTQPLFPGPSSVNLMTNCNERNKQWQMELMMERLRAKKGQQKSFADISKSVRMTMLDKRYALDAVEKANLQKCLDAMQYSIRVTTRQSLVERLESLSRQLGLKFMDDNSNLFIASDMFYLEIIVDNSGTAHDVKVHHECKIEQQSCKELIDSLRRNDFPDFQNQLEGLASIYQLNADKSTKSNAYVALQALETDLQNLYMLHQFYQDSFTLLMQSPVGILSARRGGHPMRLTYFVPPYELLDVEKKSLLTINDDLFKGHNDKKKPIGMSATVHLEASSKHKLQISPTLIVTKDAKGHSSPIYEPMSSTNSIMLPAYFVLRLNEGMPIGIQTLIEMQKITDIKFDEKVTINPQPMLNLIAQHVTEGAMTDATKGIFVTLPDQNHCYFMSENSNMKVSDIDRFIEVI